MGENQLFESYKKILYYHYVNINENKFNEEIINFNKYFMINRKLKGGYLIITIEELKQFANISKKYIMLFVNKFIQTIKDYFIINYQKSYKEINELIENILFNKNLLNDNYKIETIKNNYFKDRRFILFKLNNLFNIIKDFYNISSINKTLEINNINKFTDAIINKINIIDIKHKINYDNKIISIFGNNVVNYLFL